MSEAGFNIKEITVKACTTHAEVLTAGMLTKKEDDCSSKLILPEDWSDFAVLKIVSDELGRESV